MSYRSWTTSLAVDLLLQKDKIISGKVYVHVLQMCNSMVISPEEIMDSSQLSVELADNINITSRLLSYFSIKIGSNVTN